MYQIRNYYVNESKKRCWNLFKYLRIICKTIYSLINKWKLTNKLKYLSWLLPPANEVAGRLCFYTCLWFCSQGGVADTPRQTPPWAYTHLPSACWDRPPSRYYGIQAGGTYPTWMHSCFFQFWVFQITKFLFHSHIFIWKEFRGLS